jgi:hypothetical protein
MQNTSKFEMRFIFIVLLIELENVNLFKFFSKPLMVYHRFTDNYQI